MAGLRESGSTGETERERRGATARRGRGGRGASGNAARFRLAACVLGLTLAVGALEIGLRAFHVSYPQFMRSDELVGYRLAPHVAGWYDREGHAWVETNDDGLRDVEHALAKPARTYRVAVLGDSYTEARQVERVQSFVAALDRELRPHLSARGLTLETINFGVEGYGSAQELLVLEHRVLAYAPDLVLLAFFVGNDLVDNSRELGGSAERPYFVLQDDALVLDASFRDSWAHRLRVWTSAGPVVATAQASRLGQVFLLDAGLGLKRVRSALHGPAAPAQRPTAAQRALAPPTSADDPLERSWQVTERLLARMRERCSSAGACFALVSLSTPEQVHPDAARAAGLARQLDVPDLFYAERRLAAAGERFGFPVLNLAPELQAWARQHGQFLHGFDGSLGTGHWNPLGHRLAGRRIAAWLRREVIPFPERPPALDREVAVARRGPD